MKRILIGSRLRQKTIRQDLGSETPIVLLRSLHLQDELFMKIFALTKDYNSHGDSKWARVRSAEEIENEVFDDTSWDTLDGEACISGVVPWSLSEEMPIPDLCLVETHLIVFNHRSQRIQDLFAGAMVEWIPCEIVASFDDDTVEEIPLVATHKDLDVAIANPSVRCKLAPSARIVTVGDGFWNRVSDIDNMSLYESDVTKSDVFKIEGCPMLFASVSFKKKAKEMGITGVQFERISTLTS